MTNAFTNKNITDGGLTDIEKSIISLVRNGSAFTNPLLSTIDETIGNIENEIDSIETLLGDDYDSSQNITLYDTVSTDDLLILKNKLEDLLDYIEEFKNHTNRLSGVDSSSSSTTQIYPRVIIEDDYGTNAEAVAIVEDGKVVGVNIVNGGDNYGGARIKIISPSGEGAEAAVTQVGLDGSIEEITVTNGGSGYESVNISIEAQRENAEASSTVSAGVVSALTVTNRGRGYTEIPSVTIDAPETKIAALLAVVDSNEISSVTVENAGAGYVTTPVVTAAAPSTKQATISNIRVDKGHILSVDVDAGGTNFAYAPVVKAEFAGSPAYSVSSSSLLLNANAGTLISTGPDLSYFPIGSQVTISGCKYSDNNGVYTVQSKASDGSWLYFGSNAVSQTESGNVLTVIQRGNTADLSCEISSGGISSITILNSGDSYDPNNPPDVTFSGGSGTGAAAEVTQINAGTGAIEAIAVTNPGIGYDRILPVVSIAASAGTQATAEVEVGTIASITVNDGGSGYTDEPTITITPVVKLELAENSGTWSVGDIVQNMSVVTFEAGASFTVGEVVTGASSGASGEIYRWNSTTRVAHIKIPYGNNMSVAESVAGEDGGSGTVSSVQEVDAIGMVEAVPTTVPGCPTQISISGAQSAWTPGDYIWSENGGVIKNVSRDVRTAEGTGVTTSVNYVPAGALTGQMTINSGSGYVNTPTLTITGDVGSGATAYVLLDEGIVTQIVIDDQGSAYVDGHITMTVQDPDEAGGQETALLSAVVSNGQISSITVDDGGNGYSNEPTITIERPERAGGQVTATATAVLVNDKVDSITIAAAGAGYVSGYEPDVLIDAPTIIRETNSYAVAKCPVGGELQEIRITNKGSNFSLDEKLPKISIKGCGLGAKAVPEINSSGELIKINVIDGGSCYKPLSPLNPDFLVPNKVSGYYLDLYCQDALGDNYLVWSGITFNSQIGNYSRRLNDFGGCTSDNDVPVMSISSTDSQQNYILFEDNDKLIAENEEHILQNTYSSQLYISSKRITLDYDPAELIYLDSDGDILMENGDVCVQENSYNIKVDSSISGFSDGDPVTRRRITNLDCCENLQEDFVIGTISICDDQGTNLNDFIRVHLKDNALDMIEVGDYIVSPTNNDNVVGQITSVVTDTTFDEGETIYQGDSFGDILFEDENILIAENSNNIIWEDETKSSAVVVKDYTVGSTHYLLAKDFYGSDWDTTSTFVGSTSLMCSKGSTVEDSIDLLTSCGSCSTSAGDIEWNGELGKINNISEWAVGENGQIGDVIEMNATNSHLNKSLSKVYWSGEAIIQPPIGFGSAVSVYGDYMIVGNPDSSKAYIFRQKNNTWIQVLELNGEETGDKFGCSVDIYKDTIVIGAYLADTTRGAAYVFKGSGSNWVLEGKVTGYPRNTTSEFGKSVSIFGDRIAVGADGDGNPDNILFEDESSIIQESGDNILEDSQISQGAVYIFDKNGDSDSFCLQEDYNPWVQMARIEASDGESGDKFGFSVDLNYNYLAVGAIGDSKYTGYIQEGSAYVFKNTNDIWYEQDKVFAQKYRTDGAIKYDEVANMQFGYSVSIDGQCGVLVVGAPGNDAVCAYKSDTTEIWDYYVDQSKCPGEDANQIKTYKTPNSFTVTTTGLTVCKGCHVEDFTPNTTVCVEQDESDANLWYYDKDGDNEVKLERKTTSGGTWELTITGGGQTAFYGTLNDGYLTEVGTLQISTTYTDFSDCYDRGGVASAYGSSGLATLEPCCSPVSLDNRTIDKFNFEDKIYAANSGDSDMEFGKSVSLYKNKMLVGSPECGNYGKAYLFERNQGSTISINVDDYEEMDDLTLDNMFNMSLEELDSLGLDSEETDIENWTEIDTFEEEDADTNSKFGTSVSLYETTKAIGSNNETAGEGKAIVFRNTMPEIIIYGNGCGAIVHAHIDDCTGAISEIFVDSGGENYRLTDEKPNIKFIGGCGIGAKANAVIEDGKIVGMEIENGGCDYNLVLPNFQQLLAVANGYNILEEGIRDKTYDPTEESSEAADLTEHELTVLPLSSGTYPEGQAIKGEKTGAYGIVKEWDRNTNKLKIYDLNGKFKIGEKISGSSIKTISSHVQYSDTAASLLGQTPEVPIPDNYQHNAGTGLEEIVDSEETGPEDNFSDIFGSLLNGSGLFSSIDSLLSDILSSLSGSSDADGLYDSLLESIEDFKSNLQNQMRNDQLAYDDALLVLEQSDLGNMLNTIEEYVQALTSDVGIGSSNLNSYMSQISYQRSCLS